MTTLKTLYDTETGEPTRIKYDGHHVYAAFVIETVADSENGTQYIAALDCLGTYEVFEDDETAYTDLDQLAEAYNAVRKVPLIDRIDTPFAGVQE